MIGPDLTEVLFYHLTESKLEDALPPLIDRSFERGKRVAIQMNNPELMEKLDNLLWTFREESFLPHGMDTAEMPEEQPVLLTTDPANMNRADFRFLIDGASVADVSDYERVIFMFDGLDNTQVSSAREEWRRLKGEGHALTYWQQNSAGKWEKKG